MPQITFTLVTIVRTLVPDEVAHGELYVCKKKRQIKLLLMSQNVIHYQYEDRKSSVGEI